MRTECHVVEFQNYLKNKENPLKGRRNLVNPMKRQADSSNDPGSDQK